MFHIQSNPITLRLPDGEAYDAVVELVSVGDADGSEEANDRAAENIDHMSAQYRSIHDEMTGVLNAGAFYELARGHILKAPELSWVLISANIMNFRLEITETALLGITDKCDAIVSGLREKGFLVEIDDFGKDNSTLRFLKDIPADVLKIDMSLLREIKERERSRIILKSVIGMADSLGMDVVAEGVETEQQLRALTEMGCNHFQGYYFSRPIPVDEFETKYASTVDIQGQ